MEQTKTYIVIVNFNSGTHLQKILSHVCGFYGSIYTYIIVDNASTDDSLEGAHNLIGESSVHVIYNKKNVGFASGANKGAAYAQTQKADYIIFINPDAYIEQGCFPALVSALGDPHVAAVSPVIYKDEAKRALWFTGGKIDFFWHRAVHTKEESVRHSFLSGCVLGVRTDHFFTLGGFDERFFLYYEDVDFSFLSQKKGYEIKVVPEAIAYHEEQSEDAAHAKAYFLVIAGLLFFDKNTHGVARVWFVFFSRVRYAFSVIKLSFYRVLKYDALTLQKQENVILAFRDFYNGEKNRYFFSDRQLR